MSEEVAKDIEYVENYDDILVGQTTRPQKSDLTTRLDWVFDEHFCECLSKEEKNGPTNGRDWTTWNGKCWSELFKKHTDSYNEYKRCALRALVLQSGCHVSRDLRYSIQKSSPVSEEEEEEEIKLDPKMFYQCVHDTRKYNDNHVYQWDKDPSVFRQFGSMANIRVVNGDCVEAAFLLKEKSKGKVALLNMANRWEPSAGWPMKYGTQEEQLFRRSNIYQCLDNEVDNIEKDRKWKYPIDEYGQIFSPEVVFFRAGEKDGYNFIRPRTLGIITAAATASPSVDTIKNPDGSVLEFRLKREEAEKMHLKIELLFKVCLEHGYTNVVLSAWGSGAFRTPPKHIAELFQRSCLKFGRYFENIWFSILEDGFSFRRWNKGGNMAPYAIVFNEKEPEVINYKYYEF